MDKIIVAMDKVKKRRRNYLPLADLDIFSWARILTAIATATGLPPVATANTSLCAGYF